MEVKRVRCPIYYLLRLLKKRRLNFAYKFAITHDMNVLDIFLKMVVVKPKNQASAIETSTNVNRT